MDDYISQMRLSCMDDLPTIGETWPHEQWEMVGQIRPSYGAFGIGQIIGIFKEFLGYS